VPDAGEIAVVDLTAARQVESWTAPGLRANFPLTVDSSGTALAVVFRRPARLVLINTKTGATTQQLDTCGDADDVFFDTMRRGSMSAAAPGRVDVFQSAAAGYPPWRASRHRRAHGPRSSSRARPIVHRCRRRPLGIRSRDPGVSTSSLRRFATRVTDRDHRHSASGAVCC